MNRLGSIDYRKEVSPADPESVSRIVRSCGFFSEQEVEIALELVQERLSKGIPSGYHFIFAEESGKALGYVCFGPIAGTETSYDLYWIAVLDQYRGLGIGKKLLAECEKRISEQGGKRVYVETSSRKQYEPTRAFYRRCGYEQAAVLEDFYAPGDAKVIFLKKMAGIAKIRPMTNPAVVPGAGRSEKRS